MVFSFALLLAGSPSPFPYAAQGPLKIHSATWITGPRIARYRRAEMSVRISASYFNPFDPEQIALDAVVVDPRGRRIAVPGFLYLDHQRSEGKVTVPIAISSTEALASGKASPTETKEKGEILTPAGRLDWRIRFTPTLEGVHRIQLTLRTRQGTVRRGGYTLTATKGQGGFVRVSPRDGRYFALDDGRPYWPIGTNLGWASARGTRDYDAWIPTFARSGANWGRLWLAPHWTTLALERPRTPEDGLGIGQYDLGNAWRLDHVVDLAERHGMRLALCVESYNVLRDRINWPEWERSPLNRANGGPLGRPEDFWSSPEMDRLNRMKLRYLVARWGASPAVMTWELWNEVDGVTGYDAARVRDWHARSARYLRSIDPYRHLITTSFGGYGEAAGDEATFRLSEMDYAQSHRYEDPDLAEGVARAHARLGKLGKPHFVGEIGADASGPRAEEDKEGLQIHDPLWASIAVGASGAAMPWWWDSYVYPQGHHRLFAPVAKYLKGVAFDREGFRTVTPRVEYKSAPRPLPRRDVAIAGTSVGWKPAPFNAPRRVRISKDGIETDGPLASMQQGKGNHADLHNPVTFEVELPWPSRFVTEVGDVSGWGGAKLKVSLNGKPVIERDFPDPDGDRITDTLKSFAGDYAIDLPAGKNIVVVENPGQDWFTASYRMPGALERSTPPLKAWASVGKGTVLAWVRVEDRTWRQVAAVKRPTSSAPASRLILPGVKAGWWRTELWDTRLGKVVEKGRIQVGTDRKARVTLPPIGTDLAVKLIAE
ncbi:MAG: cellulase family glycosylhydrolase [Fimbriimonas sp.]